MKVWIDITNAPHVNFFRHLIDELSADHEVLITSRDLSNTISLLDLFDIKHNVVGKHYGVAAHKKLLGFVARVFQLRKFLVEHKPDVAISHSSFYSPVVARSMGIPSIYLNDNEHAKGNIVSYLACSQIMVPESQHLDSVRRQFGSDKKVLQYPGVKEGVYLWSDASLLKARQSKSAVASGPLNIYIRPEPWTAQYYKGKKNFLDQLVIGLCDAECRVTILPRDLLQLEHYDNLELEGLVVLQDAVHLKDVLADCDLFIGAGGTMTREMAVLGVPTISIYQGELLDVDRYLLSQQAMRHSPALMVEEALRYYSSCVDFQESEAMLAKGRRAYQIIKDSLFRLS